MVSLAACATHGHAAGLGAIVLQSRLGEPLRASVPLVNADVPDNGPQCIKVKVLSLDGGVPIAAKASVTRTAQSAAIQLTTLQNLNELAVNIALSIGCTATLHRDYQVLLDPTVASPANREPLPPKSAPLSTGDAAPLPPAMAQPDANSFARSRRQFAAKGGQSQQTRPNPDIAPVPTPLKRSQRISAPTTKRISRDVLSLSMPDLQTGRREIDGQRTGLNLKLATILSAPTTETDPQKLAAIRIERDRLAAQWRDEDPGNIAALRMKVVQDEMRALREENGRSKQQNESNKAALHAALTELRYWISGLGAVLLICFGLIAWLLWKSFTDRNSHGRISWDRIVESHGADAGENAHATDAAEVDHSTTFNDAWTPPPFAAIPSPPSHDFAAPPSPPPQLHDKKDPAPSQYPSENLIAFDLDRDLEWDHPRDPSEQVLNVAEVTDVTELAEVWMAIHKDPVKLLELLEPFKDMENPDSALPWICLLDVYRAVGDSANYEAMQLHIKKTFNVNVPSWDAEPDTAHIRTLSDFSHVTEKILNLWDTDEIVPYLQELLYDKRDGERAGFDLPVYRDIMQVFKLASAPNRSKWHYHKAYAILTGTARNELEGAAGISHRNPTQDEAAVGKAGAANLVQHPILGNLKLAKDHLSAAHQRATERDWLVEENIMWDADPSHGNVAASAGEIPVDSRVSTPVIIGLERAGQASQVRVPPLVSSALVSSKQACLNTAMLDQLTPEKVLQTSFPHIWKSICTLAIEPRRLRKYLLSLSIQDRPKKRAGFPMEALKEISDIQIQNDWFLVRAATSWQVGIVNT